MRNRVISALLGVFSLFLVMPMIASNALPLPLPTTIVDQITWYDWEKAVDLNKNQGKMVFVDVYTDWCGWCKVMDKKTFSDPEVVKYMNDNFISIKLDAEQKEPITFQGNEFKHVEGGRNGVHTLAYSLLDGQMGFPSFVILNEKYERVAILNGYLDKDKFLYQMKEYMKQYEKSLEKN